MPVIELGLFFLALSLFAFALSPALRGFAAAASNRSVVPIWRSVALVGAFVFAVAVTAIVTFSVAHC